jgi:hypothetical protein
VLSVLCVGFLISHVPHRCSEAAQGRGRLGHSRPLLRALAWQRRAQLRRRAACGFMAELTPAKSIRAEHDSDEDPFDGVATADVLSTFAEGAAVPGEPVGAPGRRRGRPKGSATSPNCKKGGGKLKRVKVGMAVCRGCRKPYDTSLMSTDSAFCPDDKRAMDRLYTMACNAPDPIAAKAKLREIRCNDEQCHRMLEKYWESCGGRAKWRGKTPKGVRWNFIEYTESIEASSSVRRRQPGKMMWEDEYYAYASTPEGGSLSSAEMRINWESWVAKPRAQRPVHRPIRLRAQSVCYCLFVSLSLPLGIASAVLFQGSAASCRAAYELVARFTLPGLRTPTLDIL